MVGQAALDLVCTINDDENCIELLRSPQLEAVNDALVSIAALLARTVSVYDIPSYRHHLGIAQILYLMEHALKIVHW